MGIFKEYCKKIKKIFNLEKKLKFNDYAGVVDLGADKEFYYGEISKDDFIGIIQKASVDNCAIEAITEYCNKNNNSYFLEHALSNKRSLCLELFDNLENKNVLDYGCGLGALGVKAAQKGAIVTFVDSCWIRLKMAKFINDEINNSQNHSYLASSDIQNIKKHGKKYNLILINGLLEWIPSTTHQKHDSALQSQLNFLENCKDILTEDGRIFVAMENRFSFLYQIGYPEDHTEIKLISIKDRINGNKIHLSKNGIDYVNLTWAYNDYFINVKKIHLKVEKIFGLFPDYRFTEKIIDLNNCDNEILLEAIKLEKIIYPDIEEYNEYINYLADLNVLKHFIYSFGVILKK
jgi:2-polyprenyl-3-methyl-5-hydroxy-6-metoxy-1,4-benzoquinol methylase